MIFDSLDTKYKINISVIAGMIWIYFRTYENYRALPNDSILSVIIVGLWIRLNYLDPLFLPIGLFFIWLYSCIYNHTFSL